MGDAFPEMGAVPEPVSLIEHHTIINKPHHWAYIYSFGFLAIYWKAQ